MKKIDVVGYAVWAGIGAIGAAVLEFDAGMVAVARRQVERMRMMEWELTGAHPSDVDPDAE